MSAKSGSKKQPLCKKKLIRSKPPFKEFVTLSRKITSPLKRSPGSFFYFQPSSSYIDFHTKNCYYILLTRITATPFNKPASWQASSGSKGDNMRKMNTQEKAELFGMIRLMILLAIGAFMVHSAKERTEVRKREKASVESLHKAKAPTPSPFLDRRSK
jgi:hypothetical protein